MSENKNYGDGIEDYLTSIFFIRKVKSYFHALDVTHDGYLALDDYETIAARMVENQPKADNTEQIREVWHNVFFDIISGDNTTRVEKKVPYEEFLINCAKKFCSKNREETKKGIIALSELMFDFVDLDGNGVISIDEYRKYHQVYFGKDMGEHTDIAFASIDTNKDGVISRDEFITAFNNYAFEAFGDEDETVLPFGPLLKL